MSSLLDPAGVWMSSGGRRALHLIALAMAAANAVDSIVLWNFFPMHMRGAQPTFTDTMHGLLAVNPFVLLAIVLGAVAFRSWFRIYSVGTILLLLVCATFGFSIASQVFSNQPTPWLGLTERISQHANQAWQATLVIMLLPGQPVSSVTRAPTVQLAP